MRNLSVVLTVVVCTLLSFLGSVNASPNPAYVCSFCVLFTGLIEQSAMQIHLQNKLTEKCGDSSICQLAVKQLIYALERKVVPETLCSELGMCTQNCQLYSTWPVKNLPPAPTEWPIERRLSQDEPQEVSLKVLKPLLEDYFVSDIPDDWGMWPHVTLAMGNIMSTGNRIDAAPQDGDSCGLSCKIQNVADHKPLQDHDQDRFSSAYARRLRGNDWRGVDCDDKRDDVYPGRKSSKHNAQVDHNCNGIVGGNDTVRSYEDLFCKNSQQRGLVILGDSATAHFHIPPSWVTANNWNFHQLLPDALNEVDFPHCSWGTGHVVPEECPLQHPIPGHESGVLSLYTQLRNRNRCNHNDFQNVGVNGARMTSSMQLVNAMARNQQDDHPLLVWLALIGNDICNGHPDFSHMTAPDEFYTKAMETLTALDSVVPSGSHVVSLALFDGELLYDTMHNKQHPLGTEYKYLYDFMNCLEENPCWGWLNSNATVRRISTVWSNNLNRVYQNISDTQNFNNFKFIFYSPKWVNIFEEYQKSGRPLTDLIEPTDGFHPSQTGNALFAQQFFSFLENEHPEAIGPINPFNDEIDALFFNEDDKSMSKSFLKRENQ